MPEAPGTPGEGCWMCSWGEPYLQCMNVIFFEDYYSSRICSSRFLPFSVSSKLLNLCTLILHKIRTVMPCLLEGKRLSSYEIHNDIRTIVLTF